MNLVSAIHEYKGKQELFIEAKPDILKAMLEIAGYREVLQLIHENYDYMNKQSIYGTGVAGNNVKCDGGHTTVNVWI